MIYLLAIILSAEQFLDVMTTTMIIAKGRGSEGNGLMAKWMKIAAGLAARVNKTLGFGGATAEFVTGHMWWVIKLPIVIWAWLVAGHESIPAYVALSLACVGYVVVLVSNYRVLWRQKGLFN